MSFRGTFRLRNKRTVFRIDGKINSFTFYIKFKERSNLNSDTLDFLEENLLLLSPDEKAMVFADLICEILDLSYSYCEVFEEPLSDERYDTYSLKFRNSMEEIYLKIQNYLDQ
jgi:hypothetical protein